MGCSGQFSGLLHTPEARCGLGRQLCWSWLGSPLSGALTGATELTPLLTCLSSSGRLAQAYSHRQQGSRRVSRSMQSFLRPSSELAHHLFHHILLANTRHLGKPRFKAGRTRLCLLMGGAAKARESARRQGCVKDCGHFCNQPHLLSHISKL